MYPVLTKEEGAEHLYHRRMADDYCAKHNIENVPPPVSKVFEHKSTFVHNQIANKNKVNVEHFKNIFNKSTFTEQKRTLIQKMHEAGVEFRNLTAFKNAMFDSEELEDNHLVPMHEWTTHKKYYLHGSLDSVEADVLKEVQQGDMANLMKFCDIVDLFFYLPMQKTILKN